MPYNTAHKKRLTLLAIQEYWKMYNCSPTYRELGEILDVKESVVYKRVQKLVADGKLRIEEGEHRGIRLKGEV